jgi:lactoylglutathione lyase
MFNKVDYVMVNVSDMNRSVAFYGDTLGLSVKFESPSWSEFQTGATTLALHLIRARVGSGSPFHLRPPVALDRRGPAAGAAAPVYLN